MGVINTIYHEIIVLTYLSVFQIILSFIAPSYIPRLVFTIISIFYSFFDDGLEYGHTSTVLNDLIRVSTNTFCVMSAYLMPFMICRIETAFADCRIPQIKGVGFGIAFTFNDPTNYSFEIHYGLIDCHLGYYGMIAVYLCIFPLMACLIRASITAILLVYNIFLSSLTCLKDAYRRTRPESEPEPPAPPPPPAE